MKLTISTLLVLLALPVVFTACGKGREAEPETSPAAEPTPEWLADLRPVEGEFPLYPDRPRLFLRPEDLPAVRERIRTTHKTEWNAILALSKSDRPTERMLASAFGWQVTGDERFAGQAISSALDLAARRDQTGDDLLNAYRVWPESIVYDWCYDRFSEDQRRQLFEGVRWQLEQAGGLPLHDQIPHAGHLVNHLADAHVPAGIAFHDLDPSIWERALEVTRTQLAAKNVFYRFGASSQGNSYGVTHFNGDVRLLMLLFKATGVDLFSRFPFYREVGYYWLYTRRPGGQLLRNGDDWLDDMNQNGWVGLAPDDPKKNVWTHPWLVQMLLYGAVQYHDPYLLGEYLRLRDTGRAWTAIEDVIRRDGSSQPKDLADLPHFRWLGGPVGTLLMRTGWGEDDLVGLYKVMPLFAKNHDHLDRLSFQLYCRGALAIDSGIYEGEGSGYDSDHWLNYFQRTIAHNTLLVREPGEKTVYRGKTVQADGGQFYPDEGANPVGLEGIADPKFRIARVVNADVSEAEGWAVVTGDATAGYGGKAQLVERTFAVVFGGEGLLKATIVVRDRVASRDPSFRKVWLLHSIEEPERFANVVKINRRGGRNSGGVLMSVTLLPEPAVFEKIGGPGKEFLVDSVNYATSKGGDAEGGAWRMEVSAADQGRETGFLHALEVFSAEPVTYITDASLIEEKSLLGAVTPAAAVLFCEDAGAQGVYKFTLPAGKRRIVVTGLPAERRYRVSSEGVEKEGVTSRGGSLLFETDLKTPWEFTVTLE